jgi:hypothetical protein
MEGASRRHLVALVVLLSVGGTLVALALAGQSDPGGGPSRAPAAGLRLEPSSGDPAQLTIYLEDSGVNRPETNGGRPQVTVDCVDRDGTVVVTAQEPWPFAGTDRGINPPHVHISMQDWQLRLIARCRLAGTTPTLGGRKP